jgi:hypothetical protein
MSSIVDPHPEPPAAEELVAYLDGELPPEECRRVEERLAADADYRQQLRDLDQAWEALDVLPTPKANDDFARTTMELVTVAAQADATAVTVTAAGAQRRRMAWFAAAALAGVLMGFVLAWLLLPNPNHAMLEDLSVIRRFETLRQIEDVEFLRRLADKVPFEQLMNDEEAIHKELEHMVSLEAKRTWVEGLPPEDKVVLAAQAERFGKLDRDQKEELRALDREISAGGVDLPRMLLAYDQWLSRLTAGEREDLRQNLLDRPIEEQVDLVRRLVRQENEQAARRLSDDDAATLQKNLVKVAAEHKVALMAPPRSDDQRDRTRRALTIIAREFFRNDSARRELRDRLMEGLSPKAQDQLESLSPGRRNEQLWRWVRDSLQSKVDSAKLERFFAEKLERHQQEKLLSLPANEMQAQLERLYYASELGYGDVGVWWRQYRDSGWPPNRPGDDRRGFRPDGPWDEAGRRDAPPEAIDRDRMKRGPGGPGGPHRPGEGDFRDGRRPPFGPPPNGPRRDGPGEGPPPGGPPPRDHEPPPEDDADGTEK